CTSLSLIIYPDYCSTTIWNTLLSLSERTDNIYMPLARVLLRVIFWFILPPLASTLSLYTDCPSMSVISSDPSSSLIVPSEPLIMNSPLFGLGSTLMSLTVAIGFTPTVVTWIYTHSCEVTVHTPLLVTKQLTESSVG